jgi:hypothetical protein
MGQPFTRDEDKTFESLWARFTMQPEICAARFCKEPIGETFHAVVTGSLTENTCSLPCALKLSKEKGEKISTHIKVARLGQKRK